MIKAIVIDDEIELVEVIQEILEMSNIQVVATGNNGQQAIEMCTKHSPDFLILDLKMPKFDGIYTLEKLLEKNNPVKVIIMTGFIDERDRSDLNKFNIKKLFIKPTNPEDIVDFIKNN